MNEAGAPARRVRALGRRVIEAPEWPATAAGLLCLLAVLETLLRRDGANPSSATLLALGATLPLAIVRTRVLVVTTAIVAVTFLGLVSDQRPTVGGTAALAVSCHLLGRARPRFLALATVVPFAAYGAGPTENTVPATVLASVAAVSATLGGVRRLRAEAAERSASDQVIAHTLLEHAARGERARIARELHDVVAHHISMIAVQAETARLATPGMPDDGKARLLAIGDTAREALTEMRRLLGVLREDAGEESARRPQPGLAQLMELVDQARDSTGAHTRLIVQGPVTSLAPGIELTAYRIVQEALTNARRHAPGAAIDIELHYTDEALRLRIRDNGPGPPPTAGSGPGHGLVGMRERTDMVGGDLHIGPAAGGGFLVEALLPGASA